MDSNVKSTLISFYYLLEIIKLRIVSYNIDNKLTEANNTIKHYNNIIKPYISLYKKSMEEQERKTKSLIVGPISIDYKKFAIAMDIDYDDIKDKSVNELITIMKKIIAKKKQRNITKNEQDVIKSIVKL